MVYKTIHHIDDILSRINTHPEYSSHMRIEITRSIRDEAARHSYAIEQENGKDKPQERPCEKVHQERTRKIIQQLNDAGDYIGIHGLNFCTLAALGNLVEPETHSYRDFRKTEVIVGTVQPPEKEKVPYLIKTLVDFLESTPIHPILRAINTHIEIARIHPYEDGNGRVSRLVQNFCLQEKGYPGVIITPTEKELYFNLLRNTLKDRVEHTSSIEKPSTHELSFQQYIGTKVLESVEHLEQELLKKRMYEVIIESPRLEKGLILNIAKQLRGFGKSTPCEHLSVHVKQSQGKEGILEIMGDVSKERLHTLITNGLKPSYKATVSIETKDRLQPTRK